VVGGAGRLLAPPHDAGENLSSGDVVDGASCVLSFPEATSGLIRVDLDSCLGPLASSCFSGL
jgi:hypothetical protein